TPRPAPRLASRPHESTCAPSRRDQQPQPASLPRHASPVPATASLAMDRILNPLFDERSHIAGPSEVSIAFLLDKNPMLYRYALAIICRNTTGSSDSQISKVKT